MDASNQDLGREAHKAISMDVLVEEHRTLDEKVLELSGRSFLTPEDHVELARLKKEKLRVKDQIAEIPNVEKSA